MSDISAFPSKAVGLFDHPAKGMTLRDWFAGQVLATAGSTMIEFGGDAAVLARRAYEIADAMLRERKIEP